MYKKVNSYKVKKVGPLLNCNRVDASQLSVGLNTVGAGDKVASVSSDVSDTLKSCNISW